MDYKHGYIISGILWVLGLYISYIFRNPSLFFLFLIMSGFFIGVTRQKILLETDITLKKLNRDNLRYLIFGIVSMVLATVLDGTVFTLPFHFLSGVFLGLIILNKSHEKKIK